MKENLKKKIEMFKKFQENEKQEILSNEKNPERPNFFVNGEKLHFASKSLCCMTNKSKLRLLCVNIM